MRVSLLFALSCAVVLPNVAHAAWPADPWRTIAAAPTGESKTPTPAEMLPRSRAAMVRVEKVVAILGEELEEARDSNDTILVNCLGEVTSQANALLDAGRKSLAELERASAARDADNSARAHARIAAIQARVEQLRAVASECVGEELGEERGGTVLVAGPGEDDYRDPKPPAPPFTRPAAASPTR